MTPSQAGLLVDILGVAIVYIFAVNPKQGEFTDATADYKLNWKQRELLGDLGLALLIAGFSLQFIGAN